MSRRFLSRALLVAAIASGATGCDGCTDSAVTSSSTPELTADELSGLWIVEAYGVDPRGCNPDGAAAPLEAVEISVSETAPKTKLKLKDCPSKGSCVQQARPENTLEWNEEHQKATLVHHSADFSSNRLVETTCRLSATRILVVSEGPSLEMTRSEFELTLPVEGDQSCDPDLAAEYEAQMTCVRGETFELIRSEDAPSGPSS